MQKTQEISVEFVMSTQTLNKPQMQLTPLNFSIKKYSNELDIESIQLDLTCCKFAAGRFSWYVLNLAKLSAVDIQVFRLSLNQQLMTV